MKVWLQCNSNPYSLNFCSYTVVITQCFRSFVCFVFLHGGMVFSQRCISFSGSLLSVPKSICSIQFTEQRLSGNMEKRIE